MDWTSPAPAKLNLCLNITGKRPDGYHDLNSLAAFTAFGDEVCVSDHRSPGLRITGPFSTALQNSIEDNLILKAQQAVLAAGFTLRDHHIELKKHIPVSSGLGGGSSDVAAYLRCVAKMENLSPAEQEKLFAAGAAVGADVPVCLRPGYQIMRSTGTDVNAVTVAEKRVFCVLANPGVPVSTQAVFAALDKDMTDGGNRKSPFSQPLHLADVMARGNDLYAPAVRACPEIATLLDQMRNLSVPEMFFGMAMSGSGASCFALSEQDGAAEALAQQLEAAGYWAVSTCLITN